MTASLLNRVIAVCSFALMSMMIAGCCATIVYNEPTKPVALEPVQKVDLKVELRLTSALRKSQWEHKEVTMTYQQPLGNTLSMNSEAAAKVVFKQVLVISGNDKADGPCANGADVILIPALASVERDRPATMFGTQTTSMQVTWTLLDCEGNLLWATTVAGEGKGPLGNLVSKNQGRPQLDIVLQEIFGKSVKEMSASDVIRQYAASR
jgi:hypothetical protein